MKEMYDQWRKDLIEAGKLKPDDEINNIELSKRWQKLQVEKIKAGSFAGLFTSERRQTKKLKSKSRRKEEPETNIQEGIKQCLDALMTKAKGASYCMIVVDEAWINFRYKKRKNNLHLQVAGNKYIKPMKLEGSDIKRLEKMGIPPEPMSDEIYARDFDDEPRNLDQIVNTAIEIFNEVYHVSNRDSARVELDLGKGETEEILNEIAPFFRRRSGKKFKWNWDRST